MLAAPPNLDRSSAAASTFAHAFALTCNGTFLLDGSIATPTPAQRTFTLANTGTLAGIPAAPEFLGRRHGLGVLSVLYYLWFLPRHRATSVRRPFALPTTITLPLPRESSPVEPPPGPRSDPPVTSLRHGPSTTPCLEASQAWLRRSPPPRPSPCTSIGMLVIRIPTRAATLSTVSVARTFIESTIGFLLPTWRLVGWPSYRKAAESIQPWKRGSLIDAMFLYNSRPSNISRREARVSRSMPTPASLARVLWRRLPGKHGTVSSVPFHKKCSTTSEERNPTSRRALDRSKNRRAHPTDHWGSARPGPHPRRLLKIRIPPGRYRVRLRLPNRDSGPYLRCPRADHSGQACRVLHRLEGVSIRSAAASNKLTPWVERRPKASPC